MKMKFGAIVVDGRGKIGGHVASKNAAGAFLRTKVTPTNPRTVAQSTARALFSTISTLWAGLSAAQRAAWNEAVAEWQTTNIFGDLRKPTGKTLFQRLNNQAQVAGFPLLYTPPSKAELPEGIVTAIEIDTTAGEITLTGASTDADVSIILRASPQLSPGITSVGTRLRDIDVQDADSYSATDAYSAYVAKYGAPTAGANVFVALKYVIATGQASVPQILKASVVA